MYRREIRLRLYSAELGYDKTVRIYLPRQYDGKKRFPVLYMHDGQNIVRKARWSRHSWEVTKTLSRLHKDVIVVGIDCSKNRTQEYCPYPYEDGEPPIGGLGPLAGQYLSFLVDYVKPLIDHRFKTLPDMAHTYMAGSSLGGLITAYCAIARKGVFGKLGVFSLGYSMAGKSFENDFEKLGSDMDASYYCYVGDDEKVQFPDDEFFLHDHAVYCAMLKKEGNNLVRSKVFRGGQHRENDWARQFEDFAHFL